MDNMIGQRIKNRRTQLHITGAEIKEQTGISTGNLSSIETGKNFPSSTALIQLSKVLDCSVDWILFGKTPKSEIIDFSGIDISEQQFINQFNALSEDDKEEIIMLVQMKYNRIQHSGKKDCKVPPSEPKTNTTEIV